MRAPSTPHSKLALAAEIGAGVVAFVAFCALAGGASPTASTVRRRAVVAKTAASAHPIAAPEAASSAPVVIASASASTVSPIATNDVVAVASAVPVHGHRARQPRGEGGGGGVGSLDLDGDRVRIGSGSRVLLFGDSMVEAGLAQKLGALVKARGGTFEADGWTSSTTTMWATKDRLPRLLERVNPDVVFIALGSNECFLGDPKKAAPQVEAIVAQLQGRACVWLGPPVWKGETGIVSIERDHSTPCAFYDSGKLAIERYQDGIHPTPKGGGFWAVQVWGAAVEAAGSPLLAGSH
jgi:lysophospholipase L1-like esterase